jgi:2,4-dienoyl-CoA reductase-like NADH-dependent reductase (Old Yellow Enzyme family)
LLFNPLLSEKFKEKNPVSANLKGGVKMKKAVYPNLFKPMKLSGLRLKNRITMAPLYLGYAASGGTVSPLLLYHYKLMAQSGAAMIVVENASITPGQRFTANHSL